jgi:starvation-inducible DNA-binding protein
VKPNIGIKDECREAVVNILNGVLADEFVLYTTTRQFHWNVVGPSFGEMHDFFESQYQALENIVDTVAERSRSIGGRAVGSLAEFLELTQLPQRRSSQIDTKEMISLLLVDHETVVESLRREIHTVAERYDDIGTADFLTELMQQHEKMAWMLRAYLS